jgi:hypothetical protein
MRKLLSALSGGTVLVDPIEVERVPGHAPAPGLVGVGEQFEGGLGGGTTTDGDVRMSTRLDGFPGHLDKILRGTAGKGRWVGLDVVFDAELSVHG